MFRNWRECIIKLSLAVVFAASIGAMVWWFGTSYHIGR
jgi:hypothetical protein